MDRWRSQVSKSCAFQVYAYCYFPAAVEYSERKFVVKFDSTSIYNTLIPSNQYDINKLYGFSDNDSVHHLYSARFGWRWSDQARKLKFI